MFERLADRWAATNQGERTLPLPAAKANEMDDTFTHCGRSEPVIMDFFRWFFDAWQTLDWGTYDAEQDTFVFGEALPATQPAVEFVMRVRRAQLIADLVATSKACGMEDNVPLLVLQVPGLELSVFHMLAAPDIGQRLTMGNAMAVQPVHGPPGWPVDVIGMRVCRAPGLPRAHGERGC